MSKIEVILFYIEGRWDSIEAFKILTDHHVEFLEQKMDSTNKQFGELPALKVGEHLKLNGLEEIRSYMERSQWSDIGPSNNHPRSKEDEDSVN